MLEDKSMSDSLWSMIYRNSFAGNVGDRGTAMACEARIDNSVTVMPSANKTRKREQSGLYSSRTYIVIAVLNQKRNAFPCGALAIRILL